jgi:hypothetical protein
MSSSESYKIEDVFPRRSSDGSTTTATEKSSVSPASAIPPLSAADENEKDGDGGAVQPVRSMTSSSTGPRQAIPVPKDERRGLLPWLSLVPEVDKPHHYTNGVKWMLTLFVAVAACAAPMGSAIFYRTFLFSDLGRFPLPPFLDLPYPMEDT